MGAGTAAAVALALTAGLAGSVQVAVPLTWPRILGVVLLAAGASLALRR